MINQIRYVKPIESSQLPELRIKGFQKIYGFKSFHIKNRPLYHLFQIQSKEQCNLSLNEWTQTAQELVTASQSPLSSPGSQSHCWPPPHLPAPSSSSWWPPRRPPSSCTPGLIQTLTHPVGPAILNIKSLLLLTNLVKLSPMWKDLDPLLNSILIAVALKEQQDLK